MKNYQIILSAIIISLLTACVTKQVTLTSAHNYRLPSSESFKSLLFFDVNTLRNTKVQYKKYSDLNELELAIQEFLKEYEFRKTTNLEIEQSVVGEEYVFPYNKFDVTDKSLQLGSLKILSLIHRIKSGEQEDINRYRLAQITQAIQHKYTKAYRTSYEILLAPVYVLGHLATPRVNLNENVVEQTPDFIAQSLQTDYQTVGMNFHDFLYVKNPLNDCEYMRPKRGYGTHAGFQIKCAGDEFKVKFGNEVYSGPFNSRIYRAVGYTAPQINYVESLSVKYDRRILTEINERQKMIFKLTLAGVKLHQFSNKKYFDPFIFIKEFKLKNGTVVSAHKIKAMLILDQSVFNDENIDLKDSHFNAEYESQLSEIVFVPSTLTVKDDKAMGEEVGLWNPKDLNYENIREVRALSVISAWVGNYDVRKDNLKVSLWGENKSIDEKQIKLIIGDAGSGLGKGTFGVKGISSSEVNEMAWSVSSRYRR